MHGKYAFYSHFRQVCPRLEAKKNAANHWFTAFSLTQIDGLVGVISAELANAHDDHPTYFLCERRLSKQAVNHPVLNSMNQAQLPLFLNRLMIGITLFVQQEDPRLERRER